MDSYNFKNKTVLVTGASMGIGAAFARELAGRGAKLILVARSEGRLRELAASLNGRDNTANDCARVVVEDLARPGAARRVFEEVTAMGWAVDVLISNAGFGSHGPFTELKLDTQREAIDLNIGALVELTHTFLPMLERQQGGVIHVASTAAFQPVPYLAVYAATKAFVLSFSEALWAEYRPRGVRVLALCPGATDTPFFQRAGEGAAFGKKATPESVVRVGLRAFSANRPYVVQGMANFITTLFLPLLPRAWVAAISGWLMRPKTARP